MVFKGVSKITKHCPGLIQANILTVTSRMGSVTLCGEYILQEYITFFVPGGVTSMIITDRCYRIFVFLWYPEIKLCFIKSLPSLQFMLDDFSDLNVRAQ